MTAELRIEGLEELERKFDKLTDQRVAKRITRKAARRAMMIVRDAAKQNAKRIDDPMTRNAIWKKIAVQSGRSKARDEIVYKVGVRGGAKVPYTNNAFNRRSGRVGKSYKTDGHHFYWRFLEFGTAHMHPIPFMRPALQKNLQQVTNRFAAVFAEELEKELGKI